MDTKMFKLYSNPVVTEWVESFNVPYRYKKPIQKSKKTLKNRAKNKAACAAKKSNRKSK